MYFGCCFEEAAMAREMSWLNVDDEREDVV